MWLAIGNGLVRVAVTSMTARKATGVLLRRVTSGVVVQALGPAMTLLTTTIAKTTNKILAAPQPYEARLVVVAP
jgi:hypothetical protein